MTRKTKISIVADVHPPNITGGIANAHVNIAKILSEYYQVVFVTFNDADDVIVNVQYEVARYVPGRLSRAFEAVYIYLIWLITKLRLCRRGHAHNGINAIRALPALIHIYKKVRGSVVVIWPDNASFASLLPKRDQKWITLVHHASLRFLEGQIGNRYNPCDIHISSMLERKMFRKSDEIVVPSEYMKNVLVSLYKFDDARIVGLPVVIGDKVKNRVLARNILGVTDDDIVVYIPSGATELKGRRFLQELLDILRTGNDRCWKLYVSGMQNSDLLYKIYQHQLHVEGVVDYERNLLMVSAADVCYSPSSKESYGLSVWEAMNMGIPCVTSNAEALVELGKYGNQIVDMEPNHDFTRRSMNAIMECANNGMHVGKLAYVQQFNESLCSAWLSVIGKYIN